MESDQVHMALALEQAKAAAKAGEVPVGCVLVKDDRVIAMSHNSREASQDPCGHAELLVLKQASQVLGTWRLVGCTLYATLEPCVMCAGACLQSRLDRVVFGAWDPKFGGVESLYGILRDPRANHRCEVRGGVLESESRLLLREFFQKRRKEHDQIRG